MTDAPSTPSLPRYSYTAISQFENCRFSFYQKYILKNRPEESTLALEIGSLAHKVREIFSQHFIDTGEYNKYDFTEARDIMRIGYTGNDKSGDKQEVLLGVPVLKNKYFDAWIEPDEKSGLTYDQKIDNLYLGLKDEADDDEWSTVMVELPFECEYDGTILFGFIDKVQISKDKHIVRLVDYKSSKALYKSVT